MIYKGAQEGLQEIRIVSRNSVYFGYTQLHLLVLIWLVPPLALDMGFINKKNMKDPICRLAIS